jgi:hypothetical protein
MKSTTLLTMGSLTLEYFQMVKFIFWNLMFAFYYNSLEAVWAFFSLIQDQVPVSSDYQNQMMDRFS